MSGRGRSDTAGTRWLSLSLTEASGAPSTSPSRPRSPAMWQAQQLGARSPLSTDPKKTHCGGEGGVRQLARDGYLLLEQCLQALLRYPHHVRDGRGISKERLRPLFKQEIASAYQLCHSSLA